MGCAFNAVSKLSNDELRYALKEFKNISDSEIPSKVERSPKFEELYQTQVRETNNFGDRFTMVGHAIQSEIMYRIRMDRM